MCIRDSACTWRLRKMSNDVTSSWFAGKLWLVHPARVRVEVDRKSWSWVVQCRRAPQSGCSTPKAPVTKGSPPSSSKNCLVCRIILRIESFYTLSRPVLLSALNAILQTTVQFPLVKDDQRRVCKSCFRRLELIKNKNKAYWKHYRKNFKRSTTAQY